MTSKIFLLVFFAFSIAGCQGQKANHVEVVPPAAFAEKIKTTPNAQILDVRTPGEFAGEHIDNAMNVNWNGGDFEAKASSYDKTKPVFVYCKVGGRSAQATAKLSAMGFTEIYDLQGGMLKWSAAGFSKPSDKIIGMCDQEFGELLKTDKKVLVSFYADWCGPCKKMTPFVLRMRDEMKDTINIVRLNADENKTLVSQLKIDELPMLQLYQNGKIIWEHKGFISEADLKKQLR